MDTCQYRRVCIVLCLDLIRDVVVSGCLVRFRRSCCTPRCRVAGVAVGAGARAVARRVGVGVGVGGSNGPSIALFGSLRANDRHLRGLRMQNHALVVKAHPGSLGYGQRGSHATLDRRQKRR